LAWQRRGAGRHAILPRDVFEVLFSRSSNGKPATQSQLCSAIRARLNPMMEKDELYDERCGTEKLFDFGHREL
jgi:hypothetical protein